MAHKIQRSRPITTELKEYVEKNGVVLGFWGVLLFWIFCEIALGPQAIWDVVDVVVAVVFLLCCLKVSSDKMN